MKKYKINNAVYTDIEIAEALCFARRSARRSKKASAWLNSVYKTYPELNNMRGIDMPRIEIKYGEPADLPAEGTHANPFTYVVKPCGASLVNLNAG